MQKTTFFGICALFFGYMMSRVEISLLTEHAQKKGTSLYQKTGGCNIIT